MEEIKEIKPQEGYQKLALESSADIVFGGAAAGVGKTFCLLIDPLRDIHNPDFYGVIFRRLTTQIKAPGGLWDESNKLYSMIGGKPNQTELYWTFPKGSRIKFSHLEHEKNVYSWQGSQIPFIGFDELTHFSKETFFYLLSRNRTNSGITPYVRATCNPDPDSWVYEMIKWFIDQDGYPIPERRGKIRYFAKDGETLIWGNSVEEVMKKADYFLSPLVEQYGVEAKHYIKSFTFISGSIDENKKLLDSNPEYLSNLAAQSEDVKRRLLEGNWKISIDPYDIYDYNEFKDCFENNFVKSGQKYITVDVAMSGKDKLIIYAWDGCRLIDIHIMDKSTGKEVIEAIKEMQEKYEVPNRNIAYDANGVGAFIGGTNNSFIPNSKAFDNGSRPVDMGDGRKFKNLKTQCYMLSGERVSRNEVFITPRVANKMFDEKRTVRQRLMEERKAIKRRPANDEEAMSLIPKSEMKQKYLSGESTDLLDGFMMREIFDLSKKSVTIISKPVKPAGLNFGG